VSVGRAKSLGVDLPHERVEWFRIWPEKSSVENSFWVRQAIDASKLRVKSDRGRPVAHVVSKLRSQLGTI
jgi:hypothetical protein